MKKLLALTLMALFVFSLSAYAVETTVGGRIYANWGMYMTSDVYDGDGVEISGWNEFGLDRSYITVTSKLTDYTDINITTDLTNNGGYDGYDIILKFAYANIAPQFLDGLTFSLGLQPTKYLAYADGMWARRYLLASVGNSTGILTTSDLGATFDYALGEEGKTGAVGLSILNGTSYSDLQENNKNKDFNFYAAFMPLNNNPDFSRTMLVGQFYMGTQNVTIDTTEEAGDWKHQIISVGGKFNYKEYLDLGAEYWANTLGQGDGVDDLKQSAISIWTAIYAKAFVAENSAIRTLNLIFRYDMLDPNTDSDPVEDNSSFMLIGVECAPTKGINASINYRSQSYEPSGSDSDNYLYLNTEFRF